MDSFAELAGFYDLDYPEDSDHPFLKRLVPVVAPAHLLEVPCGSGRNVAPLLEAASREVTFMDVAPAMVRQARMKIPPADRRRARAVIGDMRSLGISGAFDLVICPREAFQLLSQPEAVSALTSLAAGVVASGLIVIDIFEFGPHLAAPWDAPPDYFSPDDHGWVEDWTRTSADRGLTVTRLRSQRFTPNGVHFEMRYRLLTAGSPALKVASLSFGMTNYSRGEFCELARQCGLNVLAIYPGYGGVPAGSRSLRQVFVLAREGAQESCELLERLRDDVALDDVAPESC